MNDLSFLNIPTLTHFKLLFKSEAVAWLVH